MNAAQATDIEQTDGGVPGVSPGVYSEADFKEISRLVYDAAGIVLPDGKRMLVYSRIAPIVRDSGCGTFFAFLETVRDEPAKLDKIVAALTTNHTYFNREPHHFEHFARHVRPALVERLLAKDAVRIWSAGCSSGEEVWTLVMTLLGNNRAEGRRIAKTNIRVLATDLAPHALKLAKAAEYDTEALSAVPAELRSVWSVPSGKRGRMVPEAQDIVRFRLLNLLGEWPMTGRFEVIFCRNVMIYFDSPTKERLVARLAEKLVPGGYLYIGHSERASGPGHTLLEPVGPTVYRRRDA